MNFTLSKEHLMLKNLYQEFAQKEVKPLAEEVDEKLHGIMKDIYKKIDDAAQRYDMKDNFVVGANIAGFEKVVDAMKAQGIV